MKLFFSIAFMLITGSSYAQAAADYYKQATDLKLQKNYEKALLAIDKALSIDSNNVDYYYTKGACLEELKNFREAFNVYDKAISLYPEKSFLYSMRGNVLLSVTRFDEAINDYSRSIALSENDSIKRLEITNRGAAKLYKRDFQGAYDDLITAYKMDSTDLAVLTDLGNVCDEVGRGNETLKYLFKAIYIAPKYYPAYANVGFKYQEMGQYKKAIEYYNKVLELDSTQALGYSNRSYNKLKLYDVAGALADVNKSLELYSENSYAYRIRALIYIEKKEFEKACTDLQTSLDEGFTVTYGDEVINLQKKYCAKK